MYKLSISCVVLLYIVVLGADACRSDEDYKSCGPMCEPTCANRQNLRLVCASVCVKGCYCKQGLLRNIDGRCVLAFDCFNKHEYICPANEYFSTCAQPPTCLTCANPRICRISTCNGDCICVPGYLRAANGTCIQKDQCPKENGGQATDVMKILLKEHTGSSLNVKTETNDVGKGSENIAKRRGPEDHPKHQGTPKASTGRSPLTHHEKTSEIKGFSLTSRGGASEAKTKTLPLTSHEKVSETKTKGSASTNHEKVSETKTKGSASTNHEKALEAKTKGSSLASREGYSEAKTKGSSLASSKGHSEAKTKGSSLASSEGHSEVKTKGSSLASGEGHSEAKTKGSSLASGEGHSEAKIKESPLTIHEKAKDTKKSPVASDEKTSEAKTKESPSSNRKEDIKEPPLASREEASNHLRH